MSPRILMTTMTTTATWRVCTWTMVDLLELEDLGVLTCGSLPALPVAT